VQHESQSVFGQSSGLSLKKQTLNFQPCWTLPQHRTLVSWPRTNIGTLQNKQKGDRWNSWGSLLGVHALCSGLEARRQPTRREGGQGLEGTQRCGSPPDHSHARCVRRASSTFTNDQTYLQPDDLIAPSDLTNLCVNKGLFSHTLGNEPSWTGGTQENRSSGNVNSVLLVYTNRRLCLDGWCNSHARKRRRMFKCSPA